MIVELINYNSVDPVELCGTADMMCYNGSEPQKSLKRSIKLHHDSVTEHISFTFMITGISSVLLSQLTRHRFFSFFCSIRKILWGKLQLCSTTISG